MFTEAVALFAVLEHLVIGLVLTGTGIMLALDHTREVRANRTSGRRSKRTTHGRRRRD